MILKRVGSWLVTLVLCVPTVNLQVAIEVFKMPGMYGYPPPMGPPPMPVAMQFPAPAPIAFQIVEIQNSKTTTTTTTEKSIAKEERTIGIAIPMGYPSPVQFAVPAYPPPAFCMKRPRPNNCPVCPPCMCNPCTPAFFSYCSPCHQKCRCRDSNDAPIPLPHEAPDPVVGPAYPMPMPAMAPPGLIVPVHHKRGRRSRTRRNYANSDESSDFSGSYSSEWTPRNRRRRKKIGHSRRRSMYRRAFDFDMSDDNDFAKPVLSYLSNDGYVKLEKRLSHDEAAELMDENQVNQKVQVLTEEDDENRQRLKVITNFEKKSDLRRDAPGNRREQSELLGKHRSRQVMIKTGPAHVLGEGKKEIVFKPPNDKKISNLSVSFLIT